MRGRMTRCMLAILLTAVMTTSGSASESGPKRTRENSDWYIGFGVGGGAWRTGKTIPHDTTPSPANDIPADSIHGAPAVMFKIGLGATPGLLIGAEFSMLVLIVQDLYNLDAVVTYFPTSEIDLYLKAGIGYGGYYHAFHLYDGEFTQTGFDWIVGLGYEFMYTSSFSIGLEIVGSGLMSSGGMHNSIFVLVTMTWY